MLVISFWYVLGLPFTVCAQYVVGIRWSLYTVWMVRIKVKVLSGEGWIVLYRCLESIPHVSIVDFWFPISLWTGLKVLLSSYGLVVIPHLPGETRLWSCHLHISHNVCFIGAISSKYSMYKVYSRSFEIFSGEPFINIQRSIKLIFKVGTSDFNPLILVHLPLRDGHMEVIQVEGVRDPCRSLHHPFKIFKTSAPEVLLQLGEQSKVPRSKVWTIGRARYSCPHETLLLRDLTICLRVPTSICKLVSW